MDRKLVRMRFDILMAMDALCADESYDDVTIEAICQVVGISRATFYRAFGSKYQIATWWQDLVLLATVREIGRSYTWRDGFLASYSTWNLLPNMNRAARECTGLDSAPENYRRKSRLCLLDTLRNHKHVEVDDDLLFQVDYWCGRSPLTERRWTVDTASNTPERMADRLVRCVPRDLFDLLDAPDRPSKSTTVGVASLMAVAQSGAEAIFTCDAE